MVVPRSPGVSRGMAPAFCRRSSSPTGLRFSARTSATCLPACQSNSCPSPRYSDEGSALGCRHSSGSWQSNASPEAARIAADRGGQMKVLYFAWLRARIGHAEENFPKPAEVNDVAGLLAWLRDRGGRYAEALRDLSVIRVAVNKDYVGPDHPIRDGDEIAIFPPVTGG